MQKKSECDANGILDVVNEIISKYWVDFSCEILLAGVQLK